MYGNEKWRGQLCLHTPREHRNSIPLNAHSAGRGPELDSSPPFGFCLYGADPGGEKGLLWAFSSWTDAAF